MGSKAYVGNPNSMYDIYEILERFGLASNGFYRGDKRDCVFKPLFVSTELYIRIANVNGLYKPIYLQYGSANPSEQTWTFGGRLGGSTEATNMVNFDRIAVLGGTECFGIKFFSSNYNGFFFVGNMEDGSTVSFTGGEDLGVTIFNNVSIGSQSSGKGNLLFEQRPIFKDGQVCYTPIPVLSADYKLVSTLKGADNACLYSPNSPLIELDGYDVVFFDKVDTTESNSHYKWTGLRMI